MKIGVVCLWLVLQRLPPLAMYPKNGASPMWDMVFQCHCLGPKANAWWSQDQNVMHRPLIPNQC
jgi:hypothetical protein